MASHACGARSTHRTQGTQVGSLTPVFQPENTRAAADVAFMPAAASLARGTSAPNSPYLALIAAGLCDLCHSFDHFDTAGRSGWGVGGDGRSPADRRNPGSGGLPDTIEDEWIENVEELEKKMDEYIHLRDQARNVFEIRYQENIDPDRDRWELCSRVLARGDIVDRLSEPW